MTEIRFFVNGHPAPGGSKSGFAIKKGGVYTGRVAIIDAGGQRTKEWRQAVSAAAMEAMKREEAVPLTGAIEVEFIFQIQRPKSHFASNSISLRPSAPLQHVTRPDCLKLARSTEDAMTGKCYTDDAQIVKETIEKAFSDQPGCFITIREAGKMIDGNPNLYEYLREQCPDLAAAKRWIYSWANEKNQLLPWESDDSPGFSSRAMAGHLSNVLEGVNEGAGYARGDVIYYDTKYGSELYQAAWSQPVENKS